MHNAPTRQELMPTITIATPVHGQPMLAHVNSLTPLMALHPYHTPSGRSWRIAHMTVSDPLVDVARNTLSASWMAKASEDDRLLFVDADVSFGWESVVELAETDYPLVGGAYRTKQDATGVVDRDYVVKLEGGTFEIDRGCIPVKGLGAGFLMVKRDVFLSMSKAHPEEMYVADKGFSKGRPTFDYFRVDRVDGRIRSEDYHFCYRAKELGYQAMLLLDCELGHTGPYTHMGNIAGALCG